MPDKDGRGPKGKGRRNGKSKKVRCENNRRMVDKNKKTQEIQADKSRIVQSSNMTIKTIGMMIFSLATVILPLAGKLDKLLSPNKKAIVPTLEYEKQETKRVDSIIQISDKRGADNSKS